MGKPNDSLYNLLITNRHEKFWNWHSSRKNMKFSEEFKSLFNSMVAYDPSHRPSLCEILFHPWVRRGRITQPDAIIAEFNKRTVIMKEKKLQEEMAELSLEKEASNSNMAESGKKSGQIVNELGGKENSSSMFQKKSSPRMASNLE